MEVTTVTAVFVLLAVACGALLIGFFAGSIFVLLFVDDLCERPHKDGGPE